MTGQKLKFVAVIAFTLAIAILISGCKGGGKKGAEIPNAFVGTEGLEVSVDPESVPSVATAGGNADVVLIVSNKGAMDAPPGALITFRDARGAFKLEKVGANDKFSFGPPPLIKVTAPLEGREATGAAGYFDGLKLTIKANEFLGSDQPVDTGLLATTCYKYLTKAAANVCVDASDYSFRKERKPCDPKVSVTLNSQGAPVAVKKIETITERAGGVIRPKFKIYISNVGKGLVINQDSLHLFCTAAGGGNSKAINHILVESVKLNDKELQCDDRDDNGNKKGFDLTGSSTKDYLLCTYAYDDFTESAGLGTFVMPLKIELSYGYTSTSAAIPIRVEKGFGCKPGNTRPCTTKDDKKGTQSCTDKGLWSAGCT